ncbi:MAG: FAD-dependent oxidoreductase [Solirubrobacteraceae bacterium]|nr:FAD-dependent oxidoreductase [Solirubrobacteraceae bacterium]
MGEGHAISRRGFLRAAGAAGAAGALGTTAATASGKVRARAASKRVAVIGGGMAGLAAAHELAERGFDVTVFERKALGGKARSIPSPGTGTGGRLDLPGEHGFRFFPGFYRNIPDSMKRIPVAGNNRGVFDNFVAAEGGGFLREGDDLLLPDFKSLRDFTPAKITETLRSALRFGTEIKPHEADYFLRRMVVFLTSCDERRRSQWENTTWFDFIDADRYSENYRKLLADMMTSSLVAAKADKASTMTIGTMAQAFLYNVLGKGSSGAPDRVLNAPTNEAWIDPWVTHLKSLGVTFAMDQEATKLTLSSGKIASAQMRNVATGATETVEADHYILAVPVERAIPLLAGDIVKADPRLARLNELVTDWMTGVQFFLDRKLPITHGHQLYVESDWAVTGISQAQFWKKDISTRYGDGSVKEVLSLDLSEWGRPSRNTGKPAWNHTREEVIAETWQQVKAHLNDGNHVEVTDDMVKHAFLDPAITYPATAPEPGRIAENEEQLLINTAGSWNIRPEAATAVPNLFLAGDYCRADVNLATMEGANETARRAVNALLKQTGATPDVRVWELYRPSEWNGLKKIDRDRFRKGGRNIFDVRYGLGINPFSGIPQTESELVVERALSQRF